MRELKLAPRDCTVQPYHSVFLFCFVFVKSFIPFTHLPSVSISSSVLIGHLAPKVQKQLDPYKASRGVCVRPAFFPVPSLTFLPQLERVNYSQASCHKDQEV